MELNVSSNVIAECNRFKEVCNFLAENKKREVDYRLSQKYKTLDFFYNELTSQKDNLAYEMTLLKPFESQIQQIKNSLEYPKQTSLKCLEMRDDRIGKDLCNDIVEHELKSEIKVIEDTELFFDDLLNTIKEQLRKYRAVIYALEQNSQTKKSALLMEKKNANSKITDLDLFLNENENLRFNDGGISYKKNEPISDWKNDTEKILEDAKSELQIGRKLKMRTEELLTLKTKELIRQHNRCNDVFQERVAKYKNIKNALEIKLSKVNENIFEMKQNMKELENAIAAKRPYIKLAGNRLSNRLETLYSELTGDDVEIKLIEELKELQTNIDNLMSKYFLAQSTLCYLNKTKNYLEEEIKVKVNSIKIDEVQCLTIRSSVHYYAY